MSARTARLSGALLVALSAVLGGCASFEFGAGDGSKVTGGAATPAIQDTRVIGALQTLVPLNTWSTAFANESGHKARLFVTLITEGPLEFRIQPNATATCSTTAPATLAHRGQTWLGVLEPGCGLQAQSHGSLPTLLRVQVESPAFEP